MDAVIYLYFTDWRYWRLEASVLFAKDMDTLSKFISPVNIPPFFFDI
jgi:hypothetical protein